MVSCEADDDDGDDEGMEEPDQDVSGAGVLSGLLEERDFAAISVNADDINEDCTGEEILS